MYAKKMTELVTNELEKRSCYNKNVVPAIVAQAIVESNNGESILACVYHNHFGMTCGAYWKGNSINMKTKEEINGSMVDVSQNFRVYATDAEGVAGFFDFISTKRYENLQRCNTPREWLETIKADGYCTASNYVDVCMKHVNNILVLDQTNEIGLPNYKVNHKYILLDNMNVRKAPSKDAPLVGHKGLSADGKKHDANKNGSLDKGTIVTCKDLFSYGSEVWLKCPSGWVCAMDGSHTYIAEV